jgi:hypothetical protein
MNIFEKPRRFRMLQRERWELRQISTSTKNEIQRLAKEKEMFANDYVEEILDKHIQDENLGRNKNFFDQRWQEVIDSMTHFSKAQIENTEMWVQEIQMLKNILENQTESFNQLQEENILLRALIQKLIGINMEDYMESKSLDDLEKKWAE